jgi:hypothetical protein
MERFFYGTDRENSETQGGKGQIRKIQNKQEGKNGAKEKKRFFYVHGGSHTCLFSIGWERSQVKFFKKTRRKEWRKEKEEILRYVEVPMHECSPSVGNALGQNLKKNLKKEKKKERMEEKKRRDF